MILNHLNKYPSQRFEINSSILKNPIHVQQPQKLGKKCMKCMIKSEKASYHMKNARKRPKKE